MQRKAIIDLMNDPVAQELLEAPIHARLAYSARDGSSRVIPVGYPGNGEVFVMGSLVSAPKVKVLAVNPKIALTVDEVIDFETRLPGPVEELTKGNVG